MPKYSLLLALTGFLYSKRSLAEKDEISMEPLITQLKSSDPEIRESALERLGAHAKPGLARTDGITALQAATSMFPPQKYEWQQV